MRWANVKHPGADLSRTAKDADEFIRQCDGELNPVGIGKTGKEWADLLQKAGFRILHSELHYFPKRFLPFNRFVPDFIHLLFDRVLGTMIYFDLLKPAA